MTNPAEMKGVVLKALENARAAGMTMGDQLDHAVRVLIERHPEMNEERAHNFVRDVRERERQGAA